MSRAGYSHFKHFLVTEPSAFVTHVQINRPKKFNAFIPEMWKEYGQIFDKLSFDSDVKAIVLSGAGDKAFTAGLDVQSASVELNQQRGDVGREAIKIIKTCGDFQHAIGSAERCMKPVICVMHGFSIGLAVDISSCADIRICSADTKFAVKEVDIGLAADIGTLSRLPKIVGSSSWIKDVALTARTFGAAEALQQGFVSQVHENKEKTLEAGLELAANLAKKSPIAIVGTKELLNHARDHTVPESLRYTQVWTASALQAADMKLAILSGIEKRIPTFEKL